jgi:hypothetical protein
MIWFLNWLDALLSSRRVELNHPPERSDLLSFLDYDLEGRKTLGVLVDEMPSEFPNIADWLK